MAAAILYVQNRRALRRERVFRDRTNPLDFFDDDQLYFRYRFRRDSILFILDLISHRLQFDSQRNNCLSPLLQFLITLRFLACGSFLLVIGDTVPVVSKATVCRCVRRVCLAVSELMRGVIAMPQNRRVAKTKFQFYQIAGIIVVHYYLQCK